MDSPPPSHTKSNVVSTLPFLSPARMPADEEEAPFHLLADVCDYDEYFKQQVTSSMGTAGRVGERIVIERVDYRNSVSIYDAQFRVYSFILTRLNSTKFSALDQRDVQPQHSSNPIPLVHSVHLNEQKLIKIPLHSLFVLTCLTPNRNIKRFVICNVQQASLHKFAELIEDVSSNPRKEKWLTIPEASKVLQSIVQSLTKYAEAQAKVVSNIRLLERKAISSERSTSKKSTFPNKKKKTKNIQLPIQPPLPMPIDDKSSSRVPINGGFTNIGNSCYMNAILQALLSFQSFVSDVCCDSLVQTIKTDSLFSAFAKVIESLRKSDKRGAIDLSQLKGIIGNRFSKYEGTEQQDAHEFLSECLNILEEEMSSWCSNTSNSKDLSKLTLTPISTNMKNDNSSGNHSPANFDLLLKKYSPIYKNFRLEIDYTILCTNVKCNYERVNSEQLFDLSLDIPEQSEPFPTSDSSTDTTSSPEAASSNCDPESNMDFDEPNDKNLGANISEFNNAASSSSNSNNITINGHRRLKQASVHSLSHLVRKFFNSRLIECLCTKCGHNQVQITPEIKRLPRILILHLKRFLPDWQNNTYEKHLDRVCAEELIDLGFACGSNTVKPDSINSDNCRNEFDDWRKKRAKIISANSDTLDSRKWNAFKPNSQDQSQRKAYVLQCVVQHRGRVAYSGHYVADILEGNSWTRYDDQFVKSISGELALRQAQSDGYIYMFRFNDQI